MLLRNRIISVLLCWLIFAPQCFAYTYTASIGYDDARANQAADILGIQTQIDRLLAIRNSGNSNSQETLLLKSIILRKILRAILEVRQACNKVDLELTYAYGVLKKEERKEHLIFELFNLASFAQLSTFYTLEPFMRIHNQFVTSAIFTTTSGSLNIAIQTLSRLYGHVAKASNVSPPSILSDVIAGGPVDCSNMPPLVEKFLNSKALNSTKTNKEELYAMWKNVYHIDASNKKNLCCLNDKKKASTGLLRSRILLLWSLHTFVQDFDRELLALLKAVKSPVSESTSDTFNANSAGNNAGNIEVVRFLKIQNQVNELISLKQSGLESQRRDELELWILERTLEGAVEIQVAADKVDEELNYNYHVVLDSLYASRAKWLQANYNLDFLQSGIMGVVAGRLYLSRQSLAGDRQFVISGGIGAGLTGLAMLQMHGFWRKSDTVPNSLAEILNLNPASEYRFSPFVSNFLNSPPPGSTDGKTRCQLLNEAWEKNKVTTMNLKANKNRTALADMPPHKWDTIKLVTNRVVLLQSLKKKLESFQTESLDLLLATE